VIRSVRHAGLRELFETGRRARVRPDLQRRALTRLKVLDEAVLLSDLNDLWHAERLLADALERIPTHRSA
jgi:plasmid maintenance system killer protein